MDIKLVPMTRDKQDIKWAKGLLVSAFPPEERPPFFYVMKRGAGKTAVWLKITADGENAGFFYLVTEGDPVYLCLFAIDPALRGQHIGTQALQSLLDMYRGKRLFLAIERTDENADNLPQRISRKNFYLRCGLRESHRLMQEGSVIYEMLGVGGEVRSEEYEALMRKWFGFPLRCFVKTRIFEPQK